MNTPEKDPARFPLPLHENAGVHRRIMEQLDKMTPEEFLESLVRTGICAPDGDLTPYYAGNAEEMPEPWAIRQARLSR